MRTRSWIWACAAALVLTTACNREEPAQTTTTAEAPAQQTAQYPQDDAAITTSVQARYFEDDQIRGRDISVTTNDGVVTLRGTVDSEDLRNRAVTVASQVSGVNKVQDELRVGTATAATTPTRDEPKAPATDVAGTSGESADVEPAWITTKIQAQYFTNPEIKPWNIDVTTSNNGIVTLEGEVDSADDKAEAVRIARGTEGVTRVEDRLRVKGEATETPSGAREGATPATGVAPVPNLPRPDAWLTAKVQSKYFLDDRVKGMDIDVDTQDGVVTLSGTVDSDAAHRRALALARNTEGVRDVRDQLKVGAAGAAADADTSRTETTELKRPDEWITVKIQSQYFLDGDVKGHQINVDTRNGVVTLTGTVASDELKQQAEQIARDTAGVTRVVNQLKVGSSGG
ncbi:MAG TPA: BON domain-containing protein [Vicinamibacterales bacterium]